MSNKRPTPKSILYIFLLVLFLPTVDFFLKIDPYKRNNEKRELAKFSGLPETISSLQKFPREFTAYLNDNFGFRNSLILGNYLVKYCLMGVSPSDKVLVGKNGWFFYAGDGEVNDCRHVSRFTEDQLSRMVMSYEMKRQWLAEQGIRYILVIAPNKSSIYVENLPADFNMIRPKSVVDDFINFIEKKSSVCVIDPRNRINSEKKNAILYYKCDSHWNNYGAFIAYSQIMESVQSWYPDTQFFTLADFVITKKMVKNGDVAGLIGGGKYLKDEDYVFKPKRAYSSTRVEKNEKACDPFTTIKSNGNSHRVVVFRDSFFTALVPYVSESFNLSRFYWQSWDSQTQIEKIIKQYKPDIIIEEIAERFLKLELNDIIKCQPQWATTLWRKKFINSKYQITSVELDSISGNDQVKLHKSKLELKIISTGNHPQLMLNKLPNLNMTTNSKLIKIIVTSNVETDMQLYFNTTVDKKFTENKSVKTHLSKGKNDVYLPISTVGIVDKLILNPATKPCELVINSIEIRAIDDIHVY